MALAKDIAIYPSLEPGKYAFNAWKKVGVEYVRISDLKVLISSNSNSYPFTEQSNGYVIEIEQVCDKLSIYHINTQEIAAISLVKGEIPPPSYTKSSSDLADGIDKAISISEVVDDKVDNLDDSINDALKDGTLDATEKPAIEKQLDVIATLKSEQNNAYYVVYNNPQLRGSAKSNLQASKTNLDTRYSTYVNAVWTLLGASPITSSIRSAYVNAYNNMDAALASFQTNLEQAKDVIQINTSDEAKEEAKTEALYNSIAAMFGNGVTAEDIANLMNGGNPFAFDTETGIAYLRNIITNTIVAQKVALWEGKVVMENELVRVGNMHLNVDGSLKILEDGTNPLSAELLTLQSIDVPRVEDLSAESIDFTTNIPIFNKTLSVVNSLNYSDAIFSFTVSRNGMSCTLSNLLVQARCNLYAFNPIQLESSIQIDLYKDNVLYLNLSPPIRADLDYTMQVPSYSDSLTLNQHFMLDAGTYQIKASGNLYVSRDSEQEEANTSSVYVSGGTLRQEFNPDVFRNHFGKNGFILATNADNYFSVTFDKYGILRMEAKSDAPIKINGQTF